MTPRISETDARALGIEGFEPKPKRNKYNVAARADRTWRSRCYDSRAEMLYAVKLDIDPIVVEVVEQPRVWLGVPENVYRPDFLVIPKHGTPYYVDVKGRETAKFKRDKKLWAKYGRLALAMARLNKGAFEFTEWIYPPDSTPHKEGPR